MRSTNTPGSGMPARRRSAGAAAMTVIGLTMVLGSLALTPVSAAEPAELTGIVLGVGADESQRIVTWYSSEDTAQQIQVAPADTVTDGRFPADAATFAATGTANITSAGGYNRHAVITGLKENTAYSYRVGSEGNWSDVFAFRTHDFEGDYDFLFLGDPQIGASGDAAKDGVGWAETLKVATAENPDAELLVSGGDHVESANNETQWQEFLGPKQLREIPMAATIGNHDVGGKAFEQHHFTPNTDRSEAYYDSSSSTRSGGDFWYLHKDVLFMHINSNAHSNIKDAQHVEFITDTVNRHGAQAKWKVVVYHHAIYSPGSHALDSGNKERRANWTEALSDLGIDMVLQGHDHSYSRSYVIKNGQKANPDEQPGQTEVFTGPGGVVYVTANSASGSKYYGLKKPDNTGTGVQGNGPDPLNPDNFWFNSVQNQENVRSYVRVKVRSDKLVLENVRAGTCAAPNPAVERGASCTDTGKPVGSVIDRVVVHPDHGEGQSLQVTVPQAAPGEFGWTVDGYNGLVDLGTAKEVDGTHFEAEGAINPLKVTDTRRTLAPWSISASVSDFQDGDKKFSGSYLGWKPRVLTEGAGATAAGTVASGYDDGGTGLSVSRPLAGAPQGHPRGEARVGADLDLKIPDSVAKGSYRATLTITALSS